MQTQSDKDSKRCSTGISKGVHYLVASGGAHFVTDEEGATLLRISKSHFRRLVSKGELPSGRRLGRRRIWSVDELLGAGV